MDEVLDLLPQERKYTDSLSTGLVQVDLKQSVVWANLPFKKMFGIEHPEGIGFYDLFQNLQILGPDYAPTHTVRSTGVGTTTKIEVELNKRNSFFQLDLTPVLETAGRKIHGIIAEVRDITEITRIDQTLGKLQNVGRLLIDLSNSELAAMSDAARKKYLAEKIETSMRETLHYEVFEVRLFDAATNQLRPFVHSGMDSDVVRNPLSVSTNASGITGYVASTKKSLLCEDTINEPTYLPGLKDARCSITVPILWYDHLVGTCNVESKTPGVFTDRDMSFLNIFAHDIAAAFHTLDLLQHEKVFGAQTNTDQIFHSVANPIDRIIQHTSVLLAKHEKFDIEENQRLRAILRESRIIQDQIAMIRKEQVDPSDAHPLLKGRRILIVDKDQRVIHRTHQIFELYGCSVEAAPNALIALKMIKVTRYDVILCEFEPDGGMNGYQLFLRILNHYPEKTVIPFLFTREENYYDRNHLIILANQRGLLGQVLKPFKQNQHFFETIERVITTCGDRDADGNLIPPDSQSDDSKENQEDEVSDNSSVPVSGHTPVKGVDSDRPGDYYWQRANDRFCAWRERIPNNTGPTSSQASNDFDAT